MGINFLCASDSLNITRLVLEHTEVFVSVARCRRLQTGHRDHTCPLVLWLGSRSRLSGSLRPIMHDPSDCQLKAFFVLLTGDMTTTIFL